MGWGSGAELACDVWEAVEPHLSDEAKESVARKIVSAFEDADCDTLEEISGMLGAVANRSTHEGYGAPKDPEDGQTYTTEHKEIYRFSEVTGRWEWAC